MYAIVEVGGHQWKVQPGTRLEINRIPTAVGETHTVERVVFAQDGQQIQVGRPYVPDAKVICEVLAHTKGPKVISYHYRRRENWRKTVGHRQWLSRLQVKEIVIGGVAVGEPPATPAKPKATPKPKAKASAEPPTAAAAKPAKTVKRATKKPITKE